MTPTEIKTELARLGIRAAKIRGQHFLVDAGVLKKIVDAAALTKNDAVLEIGPGLGVLTRELVHRAGCVVAVELDRVLAERLRRLDLPLTVIQGDVRHISNKELMATCRSSHYKLVANIPYSITSEVLEKFLLEEPAPQLLVLLVQHEVALRLAASRGSMTRVGVFVQYFGRPEILARVNREAFWPAPRVDSAIVRIRRFPIEVIRRREAALPRDAFFRIVRASFSAPRRKVVGNLTRELGESREKVLRAFEITRLSMDVRAEEVTSEEWQALARALKK